MERARGESGSGVSRDQGHDSRLGLKRFCSQIPGRQGKPTLARPPPPLGAQRESSTVARREVRCASSHRNMGTIKIHSMSLYTMYRLGRPVRAPQRARRGGEAAERSLPAAHPAGRRSRSAERGPGRGVGRGGRSLAGYPGVLKAPAPLLSAPPPRLYCSVSSCMARPDLEKGQRTQSPQSGAPTGRSGL